MSITYLHSNIIIWRERGFLTQKGTPILNASFISELLLVAQLPKQAALIHCRRHQRHSPISFYSEVAQSWRLFATPWSIAHQAPLSMGFSRQEYWRGLPFQQNDRPPLLVLPLLSPKLVNLTSTHYFHIYIPFSIPLQKYLRLSFRTVLNWLRIMWLV